MTIKKFGPKHIFYYYQGVYIKNYVNTHSDIRILTVGEHFTNI